MKKVSDVKVMHIHAKVLILVFMIIGVSTACSSKLTPVASPSLTDTPTMTVQNISSPTEVLPTITPTPVPVLQPIEYLLTDEELPVELYKSYSFVFLRPDGSITYSNTYFNPGVGRMDNNITVAAQPYLNIPYDPASANNLIEDPLLGKNSLAYKNEGFLTYTFYKGNSLISLSGYLSEGEISKRGELTVEDMVNLGKIIDARLPNELQFSPISFPEQLDQEEYNHFLKSLTLAKQGSGSVELVESKTFSPTDSICLSMEFNDTPQSRMFAIFDVQENVYIQKFITLHTQNCTFLINYHTGQYEMRLAINDKLVAVLPFEIK